MFTDGVKHPRELENKLYLDRFKGNQEKFRSGWRGTHGKNVQCIFCNNQHGKRAIVLAKT